MKRPFRRNFLHLNVSSRLKVKVGACLFVSQPCVQDGERKQPMAPSFSSRTPPPRLIRIQQRRPSLAKLGTLKNRALSARR